MAAPERWIGDYPKIGIRPAIDGRRKGVRESLEETTMGMARNVAACLSANLRYTNGQSVECVIADTCIGGVAEAAQAAAKFARPAGILAQFTIGDEDRPLAFPGFHRRVVRVAVVDAERGVLAVPIA